MARSKRLEGIESRMDAGRNARYRASVFTARHGRRRGAWTADLAAAIRERDRIRDEARAGLLAFQSVTAREAIATFTAGIADGSIRNRSGKVFKPSVVRDYTRDLARIDRVIGTRKLDEIRITDAQRVVQYLTRTQVAHGARKGELLSDSAVRNTMMAMRSMYAWARPIGLAAINPCEGLRLPVTDERKRERIAPPREAALLAAALPIRDRAAFGLACYAGLRAGELLALDWLNVGDVITVQRAWDHGSRGFIPPKSDAAYRDVPVLDPLQLILDDLAAAHGREGLLFPSQRSTERPFSHRALIDRLRKRWAPVQLTPLGLHEARHTFASLLIAAGSTPKTVTTYMGHSSIQITFDRYGHLFPGNEAEAAERVNAYIRSQMVGA